MKRRHRRTAIIVFSVLAVTMLAINSYRQLEAPTKSSRTDSNYYYCTRVVDGDTIVVKRLASVRLIGIDTPEMNYDIGVPEPHAVEAKRMCERLADGKRLRLEFDIEKRDKYGRVLAYAFVQVEGADKEVFLNGRLVEAGLARAYHIPPNSKYKKRIWQLQNKAKKANRGIWSDKRQ
ncbi:thermonuclease family protein [bacterium]|nr:thermonuclease family protein [bacterium]